MPAVGGYTLSKVFPIGQSVALEFEQGDTPQSALTRVEDIAEQSVLVAMPMRASMLIPLPPGTEVVLHAKRDDAAYMLPARVKTRLMQPVPMLDLVPTGPIQRGQQREHVRLRLMLTPSSATVLHDDQTETRLNATIINLSAGGVLIRVRQPLRVGQKIRLRVELPEAVGVVGAVAEVLRVDERGSERGQSYDLGCRFLDLNERTRDLIIKFIFRYQARLARQGTGKLA
jgi:c-di-GMP-binding flagellar brake protein YcgR